MFAVAFWPLALVALIQAPAGPAGALSTDLPEPPSIEFGELFRAVEMANLFPDQKTFADAIPREPPATVMADYDRQKGLPGFDLKTFVDRHFELPSHHFDVFKPRPDRDVRAYISDAWEALQRKPDEIEPYSSLLPLGRPYVVPGGRFSEIYYWDSFFVMLGLEEDGRGALARDMLDNMASLIDRYGHVPNGNRSYYLSRSQPPFFSCMVELIAAHDGDGVFIKYLPELQAEYDYWMDGADSLAPARLTVMRSAFRTALCSIAIGTTAPLRAMKSYAQDVDTARHTNRAPAEVYRDLRAGAETGWDFSSRWLADGKNLWTIRTTAIAPVDLNASMMHLEARWRKPIG